MKTGKDFSIQTLEDSPEQEHIDKSLYAAWQRLLDYDAISVTQKKDFRNFRQLVVWFTWLTSLFAVLYSWIVASPLIVLPFIQSLGELFKLLLVILPFLGLAFMNYAGQFAATTTWIEYRKATEMIRSAIFRYRVLLHIQSTEDDTAKSQKRRALLEQINEADAWIVENNATVTHMRDLTEEEVLQEILNEANEKASQNPKSLRTNVEPAVDDSKRNVLDQGLRSFLRYVSAIFRLFFPIRIFVKTILDWVYTLIAYQPQQKHSKVMSEVEKKEALANLGPLSLDDYIDQRLWGQRHWYVNRIKEDYLKLRRTRLLVIFLSLLISILAFSQSSVVFVPAVVALATAFSLLSNIDMIGKTYVFYQNTAEQLQDAYDEWVSETVEFREKQENRIELVNEVERILLKENSDWRDATVTMQKTNEVAIYRNLQELVQKDETMKSTVKKAKQEKAKKAAAQKAATLGDGNNEVPVTPTHRS